MPGTPQPWQGATPLPQRTTNTSPAAPAPYARGPRQRLAPPARAPQLSEEKSGTFTTRDAMRLRLDTDLGNVRVITDATNEVRYHVMIETEDTGPEARRVLQQFILNAHEIPGGATISGQVTRRESRDRLWVTYEIHVPRHYNLEVNTQAGNIQVDDLDGREALITNGGNITAGRVGGAARTAGNTLPTARLESLGGGHITVGDVVGDLRAVTVGGHITAGNVTGDAVLNTGGGHIHAGNIGGTSQLETGGGNISVEHAGSRVTASSGGGQISFGEATGAIQAHTAGGGIRVLRVAGPMHLDSTGGSIFLTRIEGNVHASTGTGSITAWLAPTFKVVSGSQLESGQGDIVVYVPRELSVTIEATIDGASGHHITSDPSFPMKISYVTGDSGKQVRGDCLINGGGEVLKLRTTGGNIQLRSADDMQVRHLILFQQQVRLEMDVQQRIIRATTNATNQAIDDHWPIPARPLQTSSTPQVRTAPPPPLSQRPLDNSDPAIAPTPPPSTPETEFLWMKLGELWWGGVKVDSADQMKRLTRQVRPIYPDVARQAGIEGTVSMSVVISEDGHVEQVKVLSGESALQSAAMDAVWQWRYQPYLLRGKPMKVVTIVNLGFRIQ
jgi:TonB family protein